MPAKGIRVGRESSSRGPGYGHLGQAGLDVGVADPLQLFARRTEEGERRQAPFGVVAVQLQVVLDEGFKHGVGVALQCPLIDEDLSQGLGLLQHPGIHGRDQGIAADEVHLQGQDAEQQIAVGCGSRRSGLGHGAGPSKSERGVPGWGSGDRFCRF
jgi:hypothetical protein